MVTAAGTNHAQPLVGRVQAFQPFSVHHLAMITFKTWTDESFHQAIKLLRWCPNKDLLAVLYDTNEVDIFRVPWERVCSIPQLRSGAQTETVAWRSDGKVIAIGWDTGSVHLFEVESGAALHVFNADHCQIVSLEWVRQKFLGKCGRLFAGLPARALGRLPSLMSSTSNRDLADACWSAANNDTSELDMLNVLDADTTVQLSIAGRLPAGVIALRSYTELNLKNPSIAHIWSTSDLASTFVLVADNDPITSLRELSLIQFDHRLLLEHREVLRSVASHLAQVDSLVEYLDTALQAMQRENETIMKESDGQLKAFNNIIEEHGVESNLRGELLHLLLCGIPSMILEQYLTQKLNHNQALKVWQKTFDAGYQSLQRLSCLHIMPAVERLLMHLDELKAIGTWGHNFGVLELTRSAIEECIDSCRGLAMRVNSLQLRTLDAADHFGEFIKWLNTVCQNLEHDIGSEHITPLVEAANISKVSNYIRNHLISDPFHEFFDSAADASESLVGATADEVVKEPQLPRLFQNLASNATKIWPVTHTLNWKPVALAGCIRLCEVVDDSTSSDVGMTHFLSAKYSREVEGLRYIALSIRHNIGDQTIPLFWVIRHSATTTSLPESRTPKPSVYQTYDLDVACVRLATGDGNDVSVEFHEIFDDDIAIMIHRSRTATGIAESESQVSTLRYRDLEFSRASTFYDGTEKMSILNAYIQTITLDRIPLIPVEASAALETDPLSLTSNGPRGTVALLGTDRKKISILLQSDSDE
ncbi:uncharacterized protein SPPG_01166 [Spizellomyces punctatus DAOM BR117]|uniref:Anaphase-promoting complex subunit 4 n=1 Tax=Spizellomyces punctatus (strain DAOM BR117) TaxID=645134 RepID=A0A0L0HS26_SPIPD|nr:uncharacterized protein SPPG_01166 [Spizellomyces punctatus DAOM BR117]KND03700.1 hypothetical protein SPPG_01166 [Spizellomyces punctatus DAOM BR117]|eukprot:XP_016611739.1 hypothetical protein SPPG_01166 [Spizellomyces punctatus DAOM BR117]